MVDIALMGRVQVTHEGQAIELVSEKQRTIVAMLAFAVPEPVGTDPLIDALWGEDLPAKPNTALQIQISRLRKLLPEGSIDTTGSGYHLRVAADSIDVNRFRRVITTARELAAGGSTIEAIEHFRQAQQLWRGSPMGDHPMTDWARADIAELIELRLRALEDQCELMLDVGPREGSAVDVVSELERLVVEHPLRERLTSLLMKALYRDGRQPDALRRYDAFRRRLADELGLTPSPDLRDLELAILTQELVTTRSSPISVTGAPPPAALTSFVGRNRERAELIDLIDQHRLVTLVGPGGVGKTRLVSEVFPSLDTARPQRAWFIPLADVDSDVLVVRRVATALGIELSPEMDPTDEVVRRLEQWSCTLLIDNCENSIDAVASLAHRLLTACPLISIVATSREPLMLQGERTIVLKGLAVAGSASGEAESLFLDRVRQVIDVPVDPLTVSELCELVDGWPLAIELIAANAAGVELDHVAADIESRIVDLDSPYRFIPGRHSSLAATLDWSYDLLDSGLQLAYRWLGTFDGQITADAAAEVLATAPEHAAESGDLRRLADRSLVDVVSDDPLIVRMLRPVVQHARALLDQDPTDRSHAVATYVAFFDRLAAEADDHFDGPDGALWIRRFAAEEPNLLRSIELAVDGGRFDEVARLIRQLGHYWMVTSSQLVGLPVIERVIQLSEGQLEWRQTVFLHGAAGYLYGSMGDDVAARAYLERCLQLEERHDDPERVTTINNLSVVLEQDLQLEAALQLIDTTTSLMPRYADFAPEDKTLATESTIAATRSSILYGFGRWPEALAAAESALVAAERLNGDHQIVMAVMSRAVARIGVGDLDGAEADCDTAEQIASELDGFLLGQVYQYRAIAALMRGDVATAENVHSGSRRSGLGPRVPRCDRGADVAQRDRATHRRPRRCSGDPVPRASSRRRRPIRQADHGSPQGGSAPVRGRGASRRCPCGCLEAEVDWEADRPRRGTRDVDIPHPRCGRRSRGRPRRHTGFGRGPSPRAPGRVPCDPRWLSSDCFTQTLQVAHDVSHPAAHEYLHASVTWPSRSGGGERPRRIADLRSWLRSTWITSTSKP